jgi:hypothetical protein
VHAVPVLGHQVAAQLAGILGPQVDQQGRRVGVFVGVATRDAREHGHLSADADVLRPDRRQVVADQPHALVPPGVHENVRVVRILDETADQRHRGHRANRQQPEHGRPA